MRQLSEKHYCNLQRKFCGDYSRLQLTKYAARNAGSSAAKETIIPLLSQILSQK
jgi:hypothetical protein